MATTREKLLAVVRHQLATGMAADDVLVLVRTATIAELEAAYGASRSDKISQLRAQADELEAKRAAIIARITELEMEQ